MAGHGQTLVGQWKLDGDLSDSGPYGADGTNEGATLTDGRFCTPNGGYYTSNSTATVFSFPHQDEWDFSGSGYSISVWIRPSYELSGWNMNFLTKWGNNSDPNVEADDEWQLRLNSGTGLLSFRTAFTSQDFSFPNRRRNRTSTLESTGPVLEINKWYHVVATFELDQSANEVRKRIYVNGVLAASDDDGRRNPEFNIVPTVNQPIYAGNLGPNDVNGFVGIDNQYTGDFDDIRYYDGVLTPTQVDTMFSRNQASELSPAACNLPNGEALFENLQPSRLLRISWAGGSVTDTSDANGEFILPELAPGSYDFLIEYSTDGTNWCCTSTESVTISSNTTLPFDPLTKEDPTTCGGSDGVIVIPGLTPATEYQYTYNGNSNAALTTNADGELRIEGLTQGTYANLTLSINGCNADLGSISLVNPAPSGNPTLTPVPPSCEGDDGAFEFTGLSSNETYQVSWTYEGGSFPSSQTTNGSGAFTISDLDTGLYTLIVVDLNGCPFNFSSANLQPVNPFGSTQVNPGNPTGCSTKDGTLQFTNLQISTAYTVSYERGTSFADVYTTDGILGEFTIDTLGDGIYDNITIETGVCSANLGSRTLSDPNPPSFIDSTWEHPSCNTGDGALVFEGLAAGTYTLNYTYLSSDFAPRVTVDGSGIGRWDGLSGGNYTALSLEESGCTLPLGTLSLIQPTTIATDSVSTTDPSDCDLKDGELRIYGLTPSTSYQISADTGVLATWTALASAQGVSTLGSLPTQDYENLTITLGSCAANLGMISLEDPATPAPTDTNYLHPSCVGNDGGLEILGLDPGEDYALTYTFASSNLQEDFTANGAGLGEISGWSDGTYTNVTLRRGNCTTPIGDVTLVQNSSLPYDDVLINHPSNCGGNDGVIAIIGLEAFTVYELSYDTNAVVTEFIQANDTGAVLIDELKEGTVRDISIEEGLCRAEIGSRDLTDPTPPNPTVNPTSPSCANNDGQLIFGGLTPGVTYQISGLFAGTPFSSNYLADLSGNASINNLSAGDYLNLEIELLNCTTPLDNESLELPVLSGLTTVPSDPVSCQTSTGNLMITGLVPGETYSFTWDGTSSDSIQGQANADGELQASNLSQGTYSNLKVYDQACSVDLGNETLSDPGSPSIRTNRITQPTCAMPVGEVVLEGLSPNTEYSLSWNYNGNPESSLETTNGSGELSKPTLDTGNYTSVTVSLAGCAGSTDDFTLSIQDPLFVTDTTSGNLSGCNNNDGFILIEGLLPTTTHQLSYSLGGTDPAFTLVSTPLGNLELLNLSAGNYEDLVLTRDFCRISLGDFLIEEPSAPDPSPLDYQNPTCAGKDGWISTENLNPSTSYTIQWTRDGLTETFARETDTRGILLFDTLNPGSFEDIFVVLNNCSTLVGSQTLEAPTPETYDSLSTNSPSSCGGDDGGVLIYNLLFFGNFTYSANRDAVPVTGVVNVRSDDVGDLTGLVAGNYTDLVVDYGICPVSIEDFQIEDPLPPSPIVSTQDPGCVGNDGIFFFEDLTASGMYTVSWDINGTPGSQDFFATDGAGAAIGLSEGTYTSLTIEYNNCSSPLSNETLAESSSLNHGTPEVISTSQCDLNDGQILVPGLTDGITYTLNYSGGSGQPLTASSGAIVLAGLEAGTVEDLRLAFGTCESLLGTFEVTQPDTPRVALTPHDPSCADGDGSLLFNQLAANSIYDFSWTFDGINESETLVSDTGGTASLPNLSTGVYSGIRLTQNGCVTRLPNQELSLPEDLSVTGVVTLASCDETTGEVRISGPTIQNGAAYELTYERDGSSQSETLFSVDDQELLWEAIAFGDYTNILLVDGSCTISLLDFTMESDGVSCDLVIPNTFTPNGDGQNDRWHILGAEKVGTMILQVFNRWGNVVFESASLPDWDGTWDGKALPVGTYYFIFEGELNGEDFSYSGDLNLVR